MAHGILVRDHQDYLFQAATDAWRHFYRSGAFGIAAGHAGVAAFQLDQAGRRTARTDAHGGPLGAGFRRRGALSIVFVRLGLGHESDSDEMALDHLADGGKERGYIASAHPLPAARIE